MLYVLCRRTLDFTYPGWLDPRWPEAGVGGRKNDSVVARLFNCLPTVSRPAKCDEQYSVYSTEKLTQRDNLYSQDQVLIFNNNPSFQAPYNCDFNQGPIRQLRAWLGETTKRC